MDYERAVRYINTDLLLTAPFDLTSLAAVLAPENIPDAPVSCLHVGYSDNMGYQASFEAFDLDGIHGTPEQSITVLLSAIEQLPETLQSMWRACSKKTFDIGYSSGVTPRHITSSLSLHTLARMQSLGIDVSITIYQMTE